jgi:hypothetical protein
MDLNLIYLASKKNVLSTNPICLYERKMPFCLAFALSVELFETPGLFGRHSGHGKRDIAAT